MDKPFEIIFDFPLAHSHLTISLKATAELHHSDPYYVIDHFHFAGIKPKKGDASILPPVELKKIMRDGIYVWVHRDSERESLLSLAAGKAIDQQPDRSDR